MSLVTLIGLTAAVCTTASFLPQVIKTLETKRTKDISLVMYAILVVGVSLWLVYGIMIKDLPIILANTVSLIFTAAVLFLKIKHG